MAVPERLRPEGPTDYASVYAAAVAAAEARTGREWTLEPATLSPIPPDTDVSSYLIGCRALGFEPTPQGVQVAGIMEAADEDGAPLYADVTVQLSRRSAKTTSVQSVYLGRCFTRRRWRILQTAQDGTRASEVFVEMAHTIAAEAEAAGVEVPEWKLYSSTGREYLTFTATGAVWRVVAPRGTSFRSKKADDVFIDEAGEHEPEQGAEVEAGALPTLDTSAWGQLTRAGTPGVKRTGPFWDSLQQAAADPAKFGACDYHAEDHEVVTAEQVADPELWLRKHPGLASGLTRLKTIQERHDKMQHAKFVREYLCAWPADTTSGALNADRWEALSVPQAEPPAEFCLAFDCELNGQAAAVAAAWVTEAGEHRVQLLEYRRGVAWLPEVLARAHAAHPRAKIAYDPIGQNQVAALALQRVPRFRSAVLSALTLRELSAGAALIAQGMDSGNLEPSTDPELVKAVKGATWRESGDNRLFGRRGGVDISPLIAASAALHAAVKTPARRKLELPATLAS